MTIFAYGSQAQGYFAKAAIVGVDALNDDMKKYYVSLENLRRLVAAAKIADKKHLSISAPILAYLQNNKLPCIPIIGASNEAMLRESMSSVEVDMTSAEADELYHA